MPTHFQGTEKETAVLDSYIKFIRASESLTGHISLILKERGLTLSQFSILETVYHLGPMCQVEIGKKILKSGGNITHVIDILEKRRLVVRCKHENDRRYYMVKLTEEGHKLIKDYFPKHLTSIRKAMSVLDDSELNELGRISKKLGLHLSGLKT